MELRSELRPPLLDETLLNHLAELADKLDGARPGEWDEWLNEFNSLAGTAIPFEHFQGIYGGECHVDWVRRVLYGTLILPAQNVTRDELIEVTRRAMPQNGDPDFEAYESILDVNNGGRGSQLIFEPPDLDPATNTWGNGRPLENTIRAHNRLSSGLDTEATSLWAENYDD